MKVELNCSSGAAPRPYPKLRKLISVSKTLVVLFHSPTAGVVLMQEGTSWRVGEYDSDWSTHLFEDFIGTLTLTEEA